MQLTVKERLLLLKALPREGDLLSLRIVRKLREELSFSEGELTTLAVRQDGARVVWNPKADHGKEVGVGPRATEVISRALQALSDRGALNEDWLSLCDKFMPEGSE
jgi:hypothetical protein